MKSIDFPPQNSPHVNIGAKLWSANIESSKKSSTEH
ncbi:hypothetical protein MSTE_03473 [Mycobacteroides stephanolepidis]|jgi:hypothetical protein|uniref:Uncharacterized protein n=1 Tax=[Mycobacterium] stephanolepidis TaxID=1520670 RepID=A0A1Z4F0Q9_9MYCO|nr:hypothetical protein MSTE_03473 [[Mycobacterium] stephanolepidis]